MLMRTSEPPHQGLQPSFNRGTPRASPRLDHAQKIFFAGVLAMLRPVDRALTALCYLTPFLLAGALATDASAAPPRGGAPAMAHAAAPHPMAAPHFAAPHPMAAPHMAAVPHAAPMARMAPRMAPHVSAPARSFAAGRAPSPRFAAQRRAQSAIARAHAERPGEVSRQANVGKAGPANERERQNARQEEQRTARPGETVGVNRQTENQNAEQRNPSATETKGSRLAEARRAPILRNPVFAGQSPAASQSRFTFRGRFAQSQWGRDHRHHQFGVVLGFAGLAFWPYAYDDFVDYTFAPYAYDTFWPYAFDDIYAGIYGGYAPEYYAPEDAYAYAGSSASESSYSRTSNAPAVAASGGNERICSGQAQGLTDFSMQKIVQQVGPDQQQQALLNDLKAATVKAVNILQAACPSELPSTPTGRLSAMRARVDAMLQAVQTVRPALERFYESLSDEQRERFNAVDQGQQSARAQQASDVALCKGESATHARLPIDRIQRTLHLSSGQDDALKALDDATARSAEMLQTKCQPTQTLTPTGRLAAMQDRLVAMSKALETTQTALNKFYGSLSDEQKAQFDRLNVRSS
jgi:hypothetical protein